MDTVHNNDDYMTLNYTLPADIVELIIEFAFPYGSTDQRLRQAVEYKLVDYLKTCTSVKYYWKLIYNIIDAGFSDEDLVAIIDNLYKHSRGWCTASIFSDVLFRAMRSENMALLMWAAPHADKHQFFRDIVENNRLNIMQHFENSITPYFAALAVEEAVSRGRIPFLAFFHDRSLIERPVSAYIKYAKAEVIDFFASEGYDTRGILPEVVRYTKRDILGWMSDNYDRIRQEDYYDTIIAAARIRLDQEDPNERYTPDIPIDVDDIKFVLRWLLDHEYLLATRDAYTEDQRKLLWRSIIKNAYIQHRSIGREIITILPWQDDYDYEKYYQTFMYPVYGLRGLVM